MYQQWVYREYIINCSLEIKLIKDAQNFLRRRTAKIRTLLTHQRKSKQSWIMNESQFPKLFAYIYLIANKRNGNSERLPEYVIINTDGLIFFLILNKTSLFRIVEICCNEHVLFFCAFTLLYFTIFKFKYVYS